MHVRTVFFSWTAGLSLLVTVWLWRTVRHYRIVRRKNRALISTIEELLGYKDELYRKKEEIQILKEQIRDEHVARLLKTHPDYTINAIAKECGISTPQTFHRLFLNYFGMTPAEYRAGLKQSGPGDFLQNE